MHKQVEIEGKTLPLASSLLLDEVLKCLISNTPAIERRCHYLLKDKWLIASKDEHNIKRSKHDLCYHLMNGDIIAKGAKTMQEILRHEEYCLLCPENFDKNNEEVIPANIWHPDKISWEDNKLIIKEGANIKWMINGEKLDCFSEISIDIFEAGKIWSHLIQSPLTVENQTDVALREIENKVTRQEKEYIVSNKEIDELKREIQKLEEANARLKKALCENPKAIKSLYRIILAMAIKKYSYKPDSKNNSATSNISGTTTEFNLTVKEDTVREWLKISSQILKDEYDLPKSN